MLAGVLAGYPVVDVKVTAVDGSYHEVDSSEMAFKIAGSIGFSEGMKKADRSCWSPSCRLRLLPRTSSLEMYWAT